MSYPDLSAVARNLPGLSMIISRRYARDRQPVSCFRFARLREDRSACVGRQSSCPAADAVAAPLCPSTAVRRRRIAAASPAPKANVAPEKLSATHPHLASPILAELLLHRALHPLFATMLREAFPRPDAVPLHVQPLDYSRRVQLETRFPDTRPGQASSLKRHSALTHSCIL